LQSWGGRCLSKEGFISVRKTLEENSVFFGLLVISSNRVACSNTPRVVISERYLDFLRLISFLSRIWPFSVHLVFTSVSCYLLLKYDSKNQGRLSREGSRRVAWMHIVFLHFRRSPRASAINITRHQKKDTLIPLLSWQTQFKYRAIPCLPL
jgi:hypothetical protein